MRYILNGVGFKNLNESLSSARKNYVPLKISEKTFDKLVNIDPSKTKKYLDKICEFYVNDDTTPEIIKNYITIYDNLVEKQLIPKEYRTIVKFKRWEDFKKFVDENENNVSATELKKKMKEDSEIVLDNKDFFVVIPKTKEASCVFGRGTPWCTAYTDPGKTNLFDQYTKENKGNLYYILNKNLPESDKMRRTAVLVQRNGKVECFDMENNPNKPVPFQRILDMGLDKDLFKVREIGFLDCIKGTYKIVDGLYNVTGNVVIQDWNKPFPIKFGTVSGYFNCSNNKLTTLEGSPREVLGGFYCQKNKLTSLKGVPEIINGTFDCTKNQLTSLEGGPKEVTDSFHCYNNKLKTLKGGPVKVGGDFDCSYNKLTTLEGAPKEVTSFYCGWNKLETLKGGPIKVLQAFGCGDNNLTSLEGCPSDVAQSFSCGDNKVQFTKEDVKKLCRVGGNIFV